NDVLAIIGTSNPEIEGIPYISLEDLISGQGDCKIYQIFHSVAKEQQIKEINERLLYNFSIEQVIDSLTILDTEKLLYNVAEFVNRLEVLMNIRITNDKKVGLYVH